MVATVGCIPSPTIHIAGENRPPSSVPERSRAAALNELIPHRGNLRAILASAPTPATRGP